MNKKASAVLVDHNNNKKIADGDILFVISGNLEGNAVMNNLDWSFYKGTTPVELKSFLGGFLGIVHDLFGEKMVTEMFVHYANEHGKIEPTGRFKMRSAGLKFDGLVDIEKDKDE